MKRRDFLMASGAAGLSWTAGLGTPAGTTTKSAQVLLELRIFHMQPGGKKKLLADFFKDVALPAYKRVGVGPVGFFEPVHGADSLSLYALVPHKSFDALLASYANVMADPEYLKGAESIYKSPLSDPPFVRMESSLMLAFEQMPTLEASSLAKENKSRIFEMRIYESHHSLAAQRKVEMFNKGGEIEIFRKTGLEPVFFGQTIIGPRMPNLTYMLVFADNATREKAWDTFRAHPDWKKLSSDPYYADTVSNITDLILRPTPYSQI